MHGRSACGRLGAGAATRACRAARRASDRTGRVVTAPARQPRDGGPCRLSGPLRACRIDCALRRRLHTCAHPEVAAAAVREACDVMRAPPAPGETRCRPAPLDWPAAPSARYAVCSSSEVVQSRLAAPRLVRAPLTPPRRCPRHICRPLTRRSGALTCRCSPFAAIQSRPTVSLPCACWVRRYADFVTHQSHEDFCWEVSLFNLQSFSREIARARRQLNQSLNFERAYQTLIMLRASCLISRLISRLISLPSRCRGDESPSAPINGRDDNY